MIPKVNIPEGSIGDWSVEKFEIKDDYRRLMFAGRAPDPGTYTRLMHSSRGCIMSDTKAEMTDHYEAVRLATGHVLINGLGLGMVAVACLQKQEVDKVTVIELEEDVIKLVKPFLSEHYGNKIEIIHCSAFDYIPPKNIRYGMVWHDIWDDICIDNWEEYKKLHRKYGRKCDWQGSWARPEIQRMLREEKQCPYTY